MSENIALCHALLDDEDVPMVGPFAALSLADRITYLATLYRGSLGRCVILRKEAELREKEDSGAGAEPKSVERDNPQQGIGDCQPMRDAASKLGRTGDSISPTGDCGKGVGKDYHEDHDSEIMREESEEREKHDSGGMPWNAQVNSEGI